VAATPLSPARPTVLDRFWSKVDDSGGAGACWPWRGAVTRGQTGSLTRAGRPYGIFKLSTERHRRQQVVRAHRFALVLKTGIEPPPDIEACHADGCVTTLCCNDAHLRWGTRDDNRADWERRYPQGIRATRSDAEAIADALDQLEAEGAI
jgi:hypothetical protein